MNSKSGEVAVGLLIGLALGSILLYVNSAEKAQALADSSGKDVHQWSVISEEPGESVLTLVAPAVAGAGVGWVIDEFSGKNDSSNSRDNNVNVNVEEGDVNIGIDGDDQDNDTNEDNDENDQDNSGNTTTTD